MTYGIATHEPPVFVFRVRPKAGAYLAEDGGEVWRDIAITGGQTMESLAAFILEAFDFDNDHLSSFFMSGKSWDAASEVKVNPGAAGSGASRVATSSGSTPNCPASLSPQQ